LSVNAANIDSYVHAAQSGSDVKIQVDTSGTGNFGGGTHDAATPQNYGTSIRISSASRSRIWSIRSRSDSLSDAQRIVIETPVSGVLASGACLGRMPLVLPAFAGCALFGRFLQGLPIDCDLNVDSFPDR
jgi:hypothetical protein